MTVKQVLQSKDDYIEELHQQRAQLLAALKEVYENVMDDDPKMWDRVRAAIARAEGK